MIGLADYYKLNYTKVGKHYGANKVLKILGTVWRSVQLARVILKQKPDISTIPRLAISYIAIFGAWYSDDTSVRL